MTFSEKLNVRMLRSHVKPDEVGLTVAAYLAQKFKRHDFAGWIREIRSGAVRLNDRLVQPDAPLRRHDCVAYFPGEQPEPDADLHFRVSYQDDDLLVLDKSGDLCVHPTGPFFRHTLWHLACEQYGELRFVNRLDRETSGLLIAARNPETAAWLGTHRETIHKEYSAIVFGTFPDSIRARGFLYPDPNSKLAKKRRFGFENPGGAEVESADTELYANSTSGDLTLVRAVPHTGRFHQIRATLCSLGFPLAGDKLYGPDESIYPKIRTQSIEPQDWAQLRMQRQALHSGLLEFRHPRTGAWIRCESPLPEDMNSCLMRVAR